MLRRVKAVRDATLRGCLEKAFALPDDSPAIEEARQQGLAGVKPGPDLEPWVRPKALGSKEVALALALALTRTLTLSLSLTIAPTRIQLQP